jgi:hypothetical protein
VKISVEAKDTLTPAVQLGFRLDVFVTQASVSIQVHPDAGCLICMHTSPPDVLGRIRIGKLLSSAWPMEITAF